MRPPRVPGEPSRHRVTIRLAGEEYRAVRRLATRERLTLTDLIRVALVDFALAGGDRLRVLFSSAETPTAARSCVRRTGPSDDGAPAGHASTESPR